MMMNAIREFAPKYFEEKKAAAFVEQLHYMPMDVHDADAFILDYFNRYVLV